MCAFLGTSFHRAKVACLHHEVARRPWLLKVSWAQGHGRTEEELPREDLGQALRCETHLGSLLHKVMRWKEPSPRDRISCK